MSDNGRRRVSYHEAGHAVVAHLLGAHIDEAVVGERDGHVRYHDIGPEAQARIALGALAAERRYVAEAGEEAGGHDEGDVRRAAQCLAGTGLDPHVVQAEAEALVDRHWGDVARVAKVLGERGRLSGDEVLALIVTSARGDRAASPPETARKGTWGWTGEGYAPQQQLAADGALTLWDRAGRGFEALMFRDVEGNAHAVTPAELLVANAVTPADAAVVGDGALVKLAAALGAEVASALGALGARLEEGRASDAIGMAAAMEKVAGAFDRLAASNEAMAKRKIVLNVTPSMALTATLQVPRTRKRIRRNALDQIESIETEPLEPEE